MAAGAAILAKRLCLNVFSDFFRNVSNAGAKGRGMEFPKG